MLDVIRNNASSWITKVILGAIAIVFVFFFGSSALRNPSSHNRVLVEVNGYPIKEQAVVGMLNLQKAQNPEYANLPDSFLEQFKQMILGGLIDARLAEEAALKAGLRVPNDELINTIKSNQSLWKNGQFDYNFYHERYRPGYQNRYGFDYEDQVRRSLLLSKLTESFHDAVYVSSNEVEKNYILSETNFKIKRILLDPVALQQNYEPTEEEINKVYEETTISQEAPQAEADKEAAKQNIRNQLIKQHGLDLASNLSKKLWPLFIRNQLSEKTIKDNNLQEKSFDDISYLNAADLLDGNTNSTIMKTIFQLSKSNPFPEEPIQIGDHFYFFKVLDKSEPTQESFAKVQEAEKIEIQNLFARQYYNQWFNDEKMGAKVILKQ